MRGEKTYFSNTFIFLVGKVTNRDPARIEIGPFSSESPVVGQKCTHRSYEAFFN